jgi:hypothetical protein
MKHILIIAALLLTNFSCKAESMAVHLGTYHHGGKCVNGVNPGIGFRADNGFVAGVYHNSCERTSFYAGYRTEEWSRMRLNFMAATGYGDPIKIAVFPSLRAASFGQTHLVVSGGYDPIWSGRAIVHFSIERRF